MGRPPKPTKLRVLEGMRGHRPLNEHEPEFSAPPENMEPPEWLTDDARVVWYELYARMTESGVMLESDVDAFAILCSEMAIYRKMKSRDQNRAATFRRVWTGLAHFGLTPATRTRIVAVPASERRHKDPAKKYFT